MERTSPEAARGQLPFADRRAERRAPARQAALLTWASDDEEGASAAGLVEDASPNGFGVRVDDTPPERGAVWLLRHDAAPERAIVRHVTPDLNQRIVGLRRIPVERRCEERQPIAGASLILRDGETSPELAEIRNFSPHGAQILAASPIAPGQHVVLTVNGVERAAVALYCERFDGRFLVGVRFLGAA